MRLFLSARQRAESDVMWRWEVDTVDTEEEEDECRHSG
jgi:hypothetical protein